MLAVPLAAADTPNCETPEARDGAAPPTKTRKKTHKLVQDAWGMDDAAADDLDALLVNYPIPEASKVVETPRSRRTVMVLDTSSSDETDDDDAGALVIDDAEASKVVGPPRSRRTPMVLDTSSSDDDDDADTQLVMGNEDVVTGWLPNPRKGDPKTDVRSEDVTSPGNFSWVPKPKQGVAKAVVKKTAEPRRPSLSLKRKTTTKTVNKGWPWSAESTGPSSPY